MKYYDFSDYFHFIMNKNYLILKQLNNNYINKLL